MRWASMMWMIVTAAVLAGAAGPQSGGAPASPSTLLDEARRAVAEEKYDEAIGHYERLRELLPQAPEVPYNMGVAAYRAGDLDRAAELFGEALNRAEEQSLRARSAYNLGTTAYARNLQPPSPQGAENPGGQLDSAIEELRRALDHYRQVLDVDPRNEDARANAELTYRQLQRLEELRRQMQQQQQQQGGQGNQDRQQEGQDQQQSQEGEEQSPQDQQQPGEQQQQQQQRQPQQAEQSPQDQPSQAGQAPDEQTEETEDAAAGARRKMTREEARRLLQSVRDKERRRRDEMARRQQGRRPPVEKDW
ncbi:MAG: tetratricopeptide repeat protein [Planctomycetota bacterium]|nr:tetratricopeptide repeat protein [Planctomycetota bacterium]